MSIEDGLEANLQGGNVQSVDLKRRPFDLLSSFETPGEILETVSCTGLWSACCNWRLTSKAD